MTADEPEHLWRLVGVDVDEDLGAVTDYDCELCDVVLHVMPGEPHPPTA
ncbi:hypothetical protein [Cellulomonas rhizosphaerae]|nr:hypothetical protein [Cellulomonas rhizosphaerae]